MFNQCILVVEDSNLLRRLVVQMLSHISQAEILEAKDGTEALEILAHRKVDMVISDHDMAPMCGQRLFEAMRAENKTRHIPFILMAANSTPESVLSAISSGVAGFLMKPFGRDQLEHQLAYLPRFRPN